jgi:O-antigen ligase
MALVLSNRLSFGPLELATASALTAFLFWTVLSSAWSVAPPAAIREVERGVLVLSALIAGMLLARRHMRPVLGGVLGGILVVCSYGLATRLFPSRLGNFDTVAGYRLADPLGYWNALGLLAAIGILIGIGFAARGRSLGARALGAAAPILLFPTLYFTFGRGAWAALAVGVVAAIAVDRRRLQLLSTMLVIAPFVSLALWLCAREPDLNRRAAALAGATSEGRRLALLLVGLAAVAAVVGPVLQFAERRLVVNRRVRIAYGSAIVALLIGLIGLGVANYGPPQNIANRVYDAFKAPPVKVSLSGNLNQRLFSLSGSGRLTQWRVALEDYRAHPLLGSGAGTYELSWLKERPSSTWKIRDAHNLYIEVLAELGPIGLALLLVAFAIPVYAAIKARRHPLVPLALGAYVAFLLHAAADWDWEMPAVTIAALLCGVAILVVARPNVEGRPLTRRVRIAAVTGLVAIGSFAFVALMGNLALAASNDSAEQLRWQDSAKQARRATHWLPWSSDPWRQLAEAQYAEGHFSLAQANFRKAIAKDPNNWLLWAELGVSSEGAARRAAIERALRLNPLAPELTDYRKDYGK